MHSAYRSHVIKELRDQQVRFAPREETGASRSCRAAAGGVGSSPNVQLRVLVLPHHRLSAGRLAAIRRVRRRSSARRAVVRRGRLRRGEPARGRTSRAGPHGRRPEPDVQCFDEDDFPVARLGLVSRRFVFAGGKKRVGFLQSSVERFVGSHVERVDRGERFSQLTAQERSQIIQRARRLARAGAGQAEVARRIAKRLNRSVEAIRYTLKLFDQKYPALGPVSRPTAVP